MAADIWNWALAMLASWELWAGGILSLSAEVAEKMFGWKFSKRGYMWVFVIAGFLVSSYRTWEEQHVRAELRNSGLDGVIEETIIGETGDLGPQSGFVLMEMEIRNIGSTASIAEWYEVDLNCGNNSWRGDNQILSDSLLQKIGQSINVTPKYFSAGPLYENTMHPIIPGASSRGWLLASFPGVTVMRNLAKVGCQWEVTFRDVHSKRYSATEDIVENDRHQPRYLPPTN